MEIAISAHQQSESTYRTGFLFERVSFRPPFRMDFRKASVAITRQRAELLPIRTNIGGRKTILMLYMPSKADKVVKSRGHTDMRTQRGPV